MNLAELLDGLPDVAVYTLDTDVSRGELVASAERLGMTLAESGLATGQVVAAMLPNGAKGPYRRFSGAERPVGV